MKAGVGEQTANHHDNMKATPFGFARLRREYETEGEELTADERG
jgi:hypothetical protein